MTSLGTDVSFHVALLVTLTGLVHHDGSGGPILLELVSIAGTHGSLQDQCRHQVEGDTSNLDRLLMLKRMECREQRFLSEVDSSG